MIHFITVPDKVNGLNYSVINVAEGDFNNVTLHWSVSLVCLTLSMIIINYNPGE